jgi:hypothetical protein
MNMIQEQTKLPAPTMANHLEFVPAIFTTVDPLAEGEKLLVICPKMRANSGKAAPLAAAATSPIAIIT